MRNRVNDTTAGRRQGEGRYDIRIQGHLADRWVARLGGMTLTHVSDGTTLLSGEVIDQAALHGLLNQVRDLGLQLLSVTQSVPAAPTCAPPRSAPGRPVVP
jgi:hypothetical protein